MLTPQPESKASTALKRRTGSCHPNRIDPARARRYLLTSSLRTQTPQAYNPHTR